MADFGAGGFNAQAPENNEGNQVIPAGEYDAVIVKSERKATKDGRGAYLSLDFQIVSGEFQNKHVFENLNIWLEESDEKKKTAVRIAKANLSELCRAVNVLNPKDSAELHNKPLRIRVVVDEGNAQYGKQNRIKGFKPRGFAAQSAPSPVPVGAGASSDPNQSPWG
jgi:predicted RNA-binding protein YlxR (DUF448 family)